MVRFDITTVPVSERLKDAKEFLNDEPDERKSTVARMFSLNKSTFCRSITRDKNPPKKHGGQNKKLDDNQTSAVHNFIRSLLAYNVQPTRAIVFGAIVNLLHAQNPRDNPPSERSFQKWYKENKLHKIRTKPLAAVRYTAAQEKDIKAWFLGYKHELIVCGITNPKNVINFE